MILLTDIEGSTRRWVENASAMRAALERHDAILTAAIAKEGGTIFKHTGDGILATMPSAAAAAVAALAAQAALQATDWSSLDGLPVRMAIHAGEAESRGTDWFGPALNRGARILGTGHGHQTLVSAAARALLVDGLPAGAVLTDLGEHRLRDLAEPERISQLDATGPGIAREFPSLRSMGTVHTHLPVQLTPFLGRLQEVRDLAATVVANRLSTVVGPGGMGKTRLALEAAELLYDEFPDGMWFVELAPLGSVEAIDRVVLEALAVRVTSDLAARELIVQAVAGRTALLVVDNCEHLLAGVRPLIDDLLRRCPLLHVLTTSREPLRVRGERTWLIPPMNPDSEGVELFVERAAATRHDFTLEPADEAVVAEVCRRLDGMPLAIELAAARTRSMSITEIADRLDQRLRLLRSTPGATEARHETLGATLDWSFDLCTAAERTLLCGLSVFSGSFDLGAAHAVCGSSDDDLATLEVLDALVDRSLVTIVARRDRTRYQLLETIRQYGAARLSEEEGEALRRRHIEHYAEVAKGARGRQGRIDVAIRGETENLRAAVYYAVERRDAQAALSIVAPLWVIAQRRLWVEAEEWALAALALPGADQHGDAMWAHVLICETRHSMADAAGQMRHARAGLGIEAELQLPPHPQPRLMLALGACWQADFGTGRAAAAEALRLARDLGRVPDQIVALFHLIHLDIYQDREAETEHVAECLRLAEITGNPALTCSAYWAAGSAFFRTDPSAATLMFERSRRVGQDAGLRTVLMGVAQAYIALLDHGDRPEALAGLAESLAYFKDAGVPFGIRRLLRDFIPTFAGMGRHETIGVIDGAGAPLTIRPKPGAAARALARSQLGDQAYDRAFSRGRAMTNEQLEAFIDAELVELLPAS